MFGHSSIGQRKVRRLAGPLDAISVRPNAAWSCDRRLTRNYYGPLIRVRRASDSTELDIGALSNGALARAQLAAFCAGTNGFVKTVYDQSGNSRSLSNSTAAAQPKIYDSATGTLVQGGNVISRFDFSDDVLSRSDSCGITGNPGITCAQLMKFNANGGNNCSFALGTNTTGQRFITYYQRGSDGDFATDYVGSGSDFTVTNQEVYQYNITQHASGGNVNTDTWRKDGAAKSTHSSSSATPSIVSTYTAFGALSSIFAGMDWSTTILWGAAIGTGADCTVLEAYFEARRVA